VLYLHIGLPRTGTTSLQAVLARSVPELARAAYLYPEEWRDHEDIAHHNLGIAVLEGESGSETTRRFLDYVLLNRAQHIVVSTEWLSNGLDRTRFPMLQAFLAACTERVSTTVVLMLRRMDDAVASMYLHETKWGEQTDFDMDQYVMFRLTWIAELFEGLQRLRETSCVSSMAVIPYLDGFDSVVRVLAAMGLSDSGISTAQRARLGRRLGLKAHAALRYLDEWKVELGCPIRSDVVGLFESGEFTFRDDADDYDILGYETRQFLHDHALQAAREHGIDPYLEAFADARIQQSERRTIARTLIAPGDLADLREELARRAGRHA
jgi:hypothetical protein